MMPVELKLITERTHDLIAAANHTLEYSKTVIEQSKKLILGINENAFKEKGGAKTSDKLDEAQVAVFVTMPPVRRLQDKEKASPRSPIGSGSG